jgi:hypothetical protein
LLSMNTVIRMQPHSAYTVGCDSNWPCRLVIQGLVRNCLSRVQAARI